MRRLVFANRVRREVTWILLAVLSQVGAYAHATACAAALDAEARRGVGRPLAEQATALARVAFDALENKRQELPPKKHGNIPL